jgi:SAM-dependent methyltransferase
MVGAMSTAPPSADFVFDTLFAYQRSAALKAALDLDLFTAIDNGATTVAAAASRCGTSERGMRILCDYLTTIDLLEKSGTGYTLPAPSAAFLSQKSPMYLGTTARFLTLPGIRTNFDDLTGAVQRGGVAESGNTVAPENPIWVEFARTMFPMMMPAAFAIGDILGIEKAGPVRVLDIAASHGMFGITLAKRNPAVEVTALDWAPVLQVTAEHAQAHGVADRVHPLAGDAFTVDFGSGYDIVLVTNFLHHFDHTTCVAFLAKVRRSMKTGGRVVILEMVPNADRVTPPVPARFSLTMLAGTPAGDAYTLNELRDQLDKSGFGEVSAHSLPTPQTVVVGTAR